MTRLEHEPHTAKIINRADFDKDFVHGYVILEFNPERVEVLTDRRSGKQIRRTLLADITYRCVRCQFDSLDKKRLEEHLSEGNHPWKYGPFQNPYGHIADAQIEGIEDYETFLKEIE